MSKPIKARVSLLVALAAILVAGGLAAVRFVQASQGDPALPVGSWTIEVQPEPGSPLPPGVNFSAFTREGILINSNHTGHASVGSWIKVGSRSYAVTFTGFEEVPGLGVIHFIARATLELSADNANLDGPFQTDIYAADDTLITTVTGEIHGERFTVVPLP